MDDRTTVEMNKTEETKETKETIKIKKKILDLKEKSGKERLQLAVFAGLVGITILSLICFCVFRLEYLMHSDMSAEVILSKLLADENHLISKNWYYSTEIRILYSQLIMMPLFKVISDYGTVKLISIFIFYLLLIVAWLYAARKLEIRGKWALLGMALLFTPLSNEYLDMMLVGCFYTTQVICTFFVLGLVLGKKTEPGQWWRRGTVLTVLAFFLGLTGVRFLANLFVPFAVAVGIVLLTEKIGDIRDPENRKKDSTICNPVSMIGYSTLALLGLGSAGIGFLVNKFYLAVNYSFDTTSEFAYVPLSEVPERFLVSFKLMIEFFGYNEAKVLSKFGVINLTKFAFLIFFAGVVIYLWKHRKDKLNLPERLLLYYFLAEFLINWYMLVFSEVLQQYRYWIPIYITGLLLMGVFFRIYKPEKKVIKAALALLAAATVFGSLYGELWKAANYNDCAKRYDYVEFLEEKGYTFGYATFWNASVTEYLTNGKVKVGNLGGENGKSAPYEWLTPKDYYQKGFHTGKTFLLLARTEEAGMLNGDFTVMPDGKKVYEDAQYVIYEGKGMYLFSEEQ